MKTEDVLGLSEIQSTYMICTDREGFIPPHWHDSVPFSTQLSYNGFFHNYGERCTLVEV